MKTQELKDKQASQLVGESWDVLEEINKDFPLGVAYFLVNKYWLACRMLDRDENKDDAISEMHQCLIFIKDNIMPDPLENITCVKTLTANLYRASAPKEWGGWL